MTKTVHCVQNWVGCTGAHPLTLAALTGVPRQRGHAVRWAVSWLCPGRVAGPGGRIVALPRALHGRVMALCRDTTPCLMPPSGHDTHFVSRPSLCLLLYLSPHSSVTIQHLVLRHNPPACHSTLLSRYNALYRDILIQPGHARAQLAVSLPLSAVLQPFSLPCRGSVQSYRG